MNKALLKAGLIFILVNIIFSKSYKPHGASLLLSPPYALCPERPLDR